MLVTCRQMQEMESRAFASGLDAADLMEQAGQGIARVVHQFFPAAGTLILYLGSGNNAGDALVAARELQGDGWDVKIRASVPLDEMKPLPKKHWRSLGRAEVLESAPTAMSRTPIVLLDGLVGIGARGPLRPRLRELAAEMNSLRPRLGAQTVAIDIPSGLDGDAGIPEADCVMADITATIAVPKLGLLADSAIRHVGRLALVPLPSLVAFAEGESLDSSELITPSQLRPWLPRRAFDMHKGQAGRVGIMAGSRGYFGAAQLACHAALRAGAGLVTLLVKPDAYDILAQRVPAEVMVKPVKDYREALDLRFDALAIGPGLGLTYQDEYLDVIQQSTVPMLLDADALTALASHPEILSKVQAPCLLTPHPGEMARLMPEGGVLSRADQAETWAQAHLQQTLLLKGSRTVIAHAGEHTRFNTTGHAGMATGGMGDVLTGVCAALLGQCLTTYHTAALGAWLCGRAAEIHALSQAQESTLPTDVIQCLGQAWQGIVTGEVF